MRKIRFIAGAFILLAAAPTFAQVTGGGFGGWFGLCLDPKNTMPYAPGTGGLNVNNELISGSMGFSGTVTYGGSAGPCYVPAQTFAFPGRFAFGVGPVGSVQSTFDDNMALTVGWPTDPCGSFTYGVITTNGETPAQGQPFTSTRIDFLGASNRYWSVTGDGTGWTVEVQGRAVGDAVRMQWTIFNRATVTNSLGLLFGCTLGMLTAPGTADTTGADEAFSELGGRAIKNTAEGYNGFIVTPTGKPLRTQARWTSSDQNFPAYVKYLFGQSENYGIRVDNNPTSDTADATKADFFITAFAGQPGRPGILWGGGAGGDTKMSFTLPYDGSGLKNVDDILQEEMGFIQKFPGQPVAPGASRTVVHYVRTSWSTGTYLDPYTVLLDAPKLVSYTNGNFTASTPNPMTIRAILDNQYADINKSIDQHNVIHTLTLGKGLKPGPGEIGVVDSNGLYNIVKNIPLVQANKRSFTDFSVVSDGVTFGDIPITLTLNPTPGPTRTIGTTIRVGANNNITVNAGANMVGVPYKFGDSSLDKILTKADGTPLQTGTDYVAYQWDADLKGYTPTQSVQRGVGYWLVASNASTITLKGANEPDDMKLGGFLISLKQGWNMVSNPYPYPISLSQIVGVAETNPGQALSWDELVTAQYVQPSLAYFAPDATLASGGSYKFSTSSDYLLEPQRGYWIFVTTTQPVRLSWPAVYYEGLPGSGRAANVDTFKQTDKNWKLQLSARSNKGADTFNFVGLVADSKKASRLRIPKPPQAPGSKLELAVMDTFQGVQRGWLRRSAIELERSSGQSTSRQTLRVMSPSLGQTSPPYLAICERRWSTWPRVKKLTCAPPDRIRSTRRKPEHEALRLPSFPAALVSR